MYVCVAVVVALCILLILLHLKLPYLLLEYHSVLWSQLASKFHLYFLSKGESFVSDRPVRVFARRQKVRRSRQSVTDVSGDVVRRRHPRRCQRASVRLPQL